MRKPLGKYEHGQVKVGDTVHIRAVVTAVRAEELSVELRSKTDQFTVRVRVDLCELDLPDLPSEPPDRTIWKTGAAGAAGGAGIFERADAAAPTDPGDRRYPCRWWSYVDQEWVDWPYVATSGAGATAVVTTAAVPAARDAYTGPLPRSVQRMVDETLKMSTIDGRSRTARALRTLIHSDRGIYVPIEDLDGYLRWLHDRGRARRVPETSAGPERWIWASEPPA